MLLLGAGGFFDDRDSVFGEHLLAFGKIFVDLRGIALAERNEQRNQQKSLTTKVCVRPGQSAPSCCFERTAMIQVPLNLIRAIKERKSHFK